METLIMLRRYTIS